jgi:murein DD-endopeptidase MepM/ murein hydrolase activator NlpD
LYKSHDDLDGIGAAPRAGALAVAAPALPTWRKRIKRRFGDVRLASCVAHDLAEEIGSARWYRGFATMLALGAVALACWPDFSAVEAATSVRADADVRAEYGEQTIAAFGSAPRPRRTPATSEAVRPIAAVPERATIALVATYGAGDSVARMLQRAGVSAPDASAAAAMIAAVMPAGDLKPGTRFAATLGQRAAAGAPRALDRLQFRARFDLDLVIDRQGGSLAIGKQPVAIDATPLRIRGTVGSSLYRSARAGGAPMKAIEQYLQTVAAHLSLDGDIAPSDQFDMIVTYKRSAGGGNEVGGLVYAGLERAGKPLAQLVRWKDGRFVDAAAMNQPQVMGPSPGGMIAPVNGHMTSPYGARRHPILGYVRMHSGIDFGAVWGSPIFAVSDGVVAFAGRHGGHGNMVKLDHGGGLGTGYAHMSRVAVATGAHVQAGQVIGYVGSTGLSTGPHLHYELYRNGRAVNPLGVSFAFRAASVDKGELDAVKGKIAALKRVAPGAALEKLAARSAAAKPESD